MNRKPSLILALDVDTLQKARQFIGSLYPQVRIFKIGPVLFTAYGPAIIKLISKKGAEVFLDLKFHDIPNTVAAAVRQAVRLKVKMLTLHTQGGTEMIKAAVKAAEEESRLTRIKRPLLIGVTVLTSQEAAPKEVLRSARLGIENGLDGVVCSVKEAASLRKAIKKDFIIVTPGIRAKDTVADDQKRTATAAEAMDAGSNFLVVGRPILNAENPLEAVKNLF